MARTRKSEADGLDVDLEDLPAPARWREWMSRVEAVVFAADKPVSREQLARVVGKACPLELIIDDLREDLRGRPYELISVAGGWSFRTKLGFGDAMVLMAVGYFQPITRGDLSLLLGREVSRDAIASLRGEGLIAAGPRSPALGAPYAYVTTPGFLSHYGFESLRNLPDIEKLEDAGLIGRAGDGAISGDGLAGEPRTVLGLADDDDKPEEDAA
jgi:segregation and condensation protein B